MTTTVLSTPAEARANAEALHKFYPERAEAGVLLLGLSLIPVTMGLVALTAVLSGIQSAQTAGKAFNLFVDPYLTVYLAIVIVLCFVAPWVASLKFLTDIFKLELKRRRLGGAISYKKEFARNAELQAVAKEQRIDQAERQVQYSHDVLELLKLPEKSLIA